jgi:hypothetical protein
MSSSDLDLHVISFQNPMRSKPVRENFTDIENNFNLLRHEVYASIAATTSEVTAARDYYPSLQERERGVAKGNFNSWVTGLQVHGENGDFSVSVDPGEAIVNGVGCYSNGTTSLEIDIDEFGPDNIYAVVINSDNSLSMLQGGSMYAGQYPSIAQTQKLLAYIHITDTASEVTDGHIEDRRQDRDVTISKLKYAGYHQVRRSPNVNYAPLKECYLNWNIDDLHHMNATYNTGGTVEKVHFRGVEPGVKTLIVNHPKTGSTDLSFLSSTLSFWHINMDDHTHGTAKTYHLATAASFNKYTVFQLFTHDGLNVFVAQNPFYKVTIDPYL